MINDVKEGRREVDNLAQYSWSQFGQYYPCDCFISLPGSLRHKSWSWYAASPDADVLSHSLATAQGNEGKYVSCLPGERELRIIIGKQINLLTTNPEHGMHSTWFTSERRHICLTNILLVWEIFQVKKSLLFKWTPAAHNDLTENCKLSLLKILKNRQAFVKKFTWSKSLVLTFKLCVGHTKKRAVTSVENSSLGHQTNSSALL